MPKPYNRGITPKHTRKNSVLYGFWLSVFGFFPITAQCINGEYYRWYQWYTKQNYQFHYSPPSAVSKTIPNIINNKAIPTPMISNTNWLKSPLMIVPNTRLANVRFPKLTSTLPTSFVALFFLLVSLLPTPFNIAFLTGINKRIFHIRG